MHILTTNFNWNPNVGLLGFCTDEYCLLGNDVPDKLVKEIGDVLNVPIHKLNICGTSLLGIFLAGNKDCLLVPGIAFDSELAQLDKIGINYKVIDTKLTALGNNILCNDNGALVSTEFSANQKKEIRQALGVKVVPGKIAGFDTVGSSAVMNSKGCLVHHDVSENELKVVEELLGVKCITGTVNMGNPFVKSGVLVNSKGFVVGDTSGGPEITNADEAFGFI